MDNRLYLGSALLALAILSGCATTGGMFGDRPFAISYSGDQPAMQRALLKHLRAKALVSEAGNKLIVDTEPYIAEAKGLFGLGPKWQEKSFMSSACLALGQKHLSEYLVPPLFT
jgi:hypothetical protein